MTGLANLMCTPELAVAAVTGLDHADVMLAASGGVPSVAFSPDGTLLIMPSERQVEIVDLASGDTLRVFSGHTRWVCVGGAFSPGWALLATASDGGTTRLWDPRTSAWRATLLALEAGGHAVLLPDGSYKLEGDPGRRLWWAVKLCRFAHGELDPYDPTIRRLPAEAPSSADGRAAVTVTG